MSWNTKVHLFDNVPFSINQEHTRFFDSKAQQDNYFTNLGPSVISTDGRYVKIHEGTIDVQRFKDTSDAFNYIMIQNTNSEYGNVRKYYAFVTNTEFISSNVTRIHFEVDSIQTFMFDMTFKKSFIERQHNKQYGSDGLPIKNVAPESINLGSEYESWMNFESTNTVDRFFNTLLVSTTRNLEVDSDNKVRGSIVGGVATPLIYDIILIPKDLTETNVPTVKYKGETLYNSGAGFVSDYLGIFDAFNREKDANKIVGLAYLPFYPFQASASKSGNTISITDSYTADTRKVHAFPAGPSYKSLRVADHKSVTLNDFIKIKPFTEMKKHIDGYGFNESKLLMHPYMKIVLYDGLGGSFEIKPQYLTDDNLSISALSTLSSSPKSAYVVNNYLRTTNFNNAIVTNMNADIEIVNEHTATYIQGRKNSDRVANTYGIIGGLSQSVAGGAIAGVSLAGGNVMGGMAGATMLAGGVTNAFNATSTITAKHEDIQNQPPSLQSQAGASNLAVAYNMARPTLQIKTIGKENMEIVRDYFHLYGTSFHKMAVPNLKTRTSYNFVKTAGANITGKIPTRYLANLKNIFDAGVTLWHTNDMYNYDVKNGER